MAHQAGSVTLATNLSWIAFRGNAHILARLSDYSVRVTASNLFNIPIIVMWQKEHLGCRRGAHGALYWSSTRVSLGPFFCVKSLKPSETIKQLSALQMQAGILFPQAQSRP